MVRGFSIFVWLFLLLLPLSAFALEDISIHASLDSTTLHQGWPIRGTLEITHNVDQKVDEASVLMEGKPLKINLLRNVKISPQSPLTVSIYQFNLPPQNKGEYTLSSISVKIDGKTYQTLPESYEIQGPVTLPSVSAEETPGSSLKLEAFIKGSKELYPGQQTYLVYRYFYQGNINLSKEVLPMLEAKGMQKIGRPEIRNYTEGNLSVFEISQEVQALDPGEYSWGPSKIEGVVYVEDALGNKQFTTTQLSSEAEAVKLIVKPFPIEGRPASFNGAFGQFTFNTTLLTPAKVSVGDPIQLNVAIAGQTSNWDSVALPELCCQPGFAGLFKLGDLPPIGKMQGESKHFTVVMHPLSSAIKNIPSIQFSYFEPSSGQYKVLSSMPIPITVSPIQEIAQVDQARIVNPQVDKPKETVIAWQQIYSQLPPIDQYRMFSLEIKDLINKPLGSWWTLWLIPLSMILLALQTKLKDLLKKRRELSKAKTSQDIYHEMLKAPTGSPLFFQLLHQGLILRLFERGDIQLADVSVEDLPMEGAAGEARAFLKRIDSLRYTSALPDDVLYKQILDEGQELFKKLQGNHGK